MPGVATLASVAEMSDIEPREISATPDWQQVNKAYQDLQNQGKNRRLRAYGQQRQADLMLERSELYWLDKREQDATNAELGFKQDEASYRQAIEYYSSLLQDIPARKGNDRLLYQLSRAYDLAGEASNELAVLNRLVYEFSQSPLIEEVQFRRGELFYSSREFVSAVEAYQGVISRGKQGRYYQSALYKLGWTQYKLGQYEKAQLSFFNLLDEIGLGEDPGKLSEADRELVQDVLRAVSLGLSHGQAERGLPAFFVRYGKRPYLPLVYQGLGELYLQQRRYTEAAQAFYGFANQYPSHARAPWFLLRGIECYELGGFLTQALAARANLYRRYQPSQPFWRELEQGQWQQFKPLLQENVRYLASYYHAEGQRTWNVATWRQAHEWYRAYLAAFPDDPSAPEMHFLLAESQYDANNYKEAGEEYERVAYQYLPHAYSAEAGYAVLQVLEKRFDLKPDTRRASLIASMERFIEAFVQDSRRIRVMQKLAAEQFAARDYAASILTARKVLQQQSGPEPGQRSVMLGLISQAEMELGNFAQAEQIATEALAAAPDPGTSGVEQARLGAAIYRQGELAQQQQQWLEAAGHFLRVPEQATEIYPVARFDAAVAMLAAGQPAQAITLFEAVLLRRVSEQMSQQAREQLVPLYRADRRWNEAAALCEALAQHSKDEDQQHHWLWQAAEAYEQGAEPVKALALYQRLVTRLSKPLEKHLAIRYRLADLYRAQGDEGRQREQLQEIMGHRQRAKTDVAIRPVVARAALDLANFEAQEYRHIELQAPFELSLRKKKFQLTTSLQAYNQAAEYGVVEVVTQATYQVAWLYQDFAGALLSSELPHDLNVEELGIYKVMLEEQAYPFEEKAIVVHESNIQRLRQGIHDTWIMNSLKALAGLQPVRYAKYEQVEQWVGILE